MANLTQERLKELLSYNPETGEFTRLVTAGGKLKSSIAGTVRQDGYLAIKIDKKSYFLHRLVWLYVHGKFPSDEIDHINCDKKDNRLSNLRDSDRFLNNQNIHNPQKNSKSGVRNVCFSNYHGKYKAALMVNGKRINVGCFTDISSAEAAILNKKKELNIGRLNDNT